ncbi:hypothetical protein [Terrisporobacter sp.]|uniref:hypothetical protein n=1 Tax=Terrisporobacter sp. TaxID=1965305 RepID=UPI0028A1E0D5|nr:hypothetical protein [Terrisporobacter sp.]
MDFVRMYAYLVIICLLVEGLLNARLFKYRKTFNVSNEILVTCLNSFIPIWNLISLIQNVSLIVAKDSTIRAMALLLDLANMLVTDLIELLCDCVDYYGDMDVLMEDDSIGDVIDLNSVKIVEMDGEEYLMLSDKVNKEIQKEVYMN